MNFYFIRHAESFKTKEDRHGGVGLPLTEQGKLDVLDLISFLENIERLTFQNSLFYCSDLIQVLETAKAIEDQRKISFQISADVKNISLGILDGLSKEEALKKYPVEASNLEKWRTGEIKIDDFTIPEAETMSQFYERVFKFISLSVLQSKDVVVIGTRSVGVAITNIFSNFSKAIDINNYKRFLFDPSSISKFTYNSNKPNISYINRTDFLNTKANHPDE